MKVVIKKDERGLLFKKGSYLCLLKPGTYRFMPFLETRVVVMDVNQPFTTEKNLNIYLEDKQLLKELDIIEINDHELAIHYEDGKLEKVYTSGKYAFWNILKKHTFLKVDIREPEISGEINPALFLKPQLTGCFTQYEIFDYEKGILLQNGIFIRILEPGKYYFWLSPVSVQVIKVDMRQQQLDMTGQEIMTEDKVSLRLNFVCQYRITDPKTVTLEIKGYAEQLYIQLQLILREYVGSLKLDELLRKKQEIGEFILSRLQTRVTDWGIEFISAGVKDVILPGEVKDILNTVLLAEKRAQANVITRREETASTRSLLNTAKLMDENSTLFRLKELEYLEKICDKIGTISLTGGGTLLEHLNLLLTGKSDRTGEKSRDYKEVQ